jgi:ATP:corrinoid adenosyltransferase
MATTHCFSTPCGHEATVKPCQSKKGPNAGKWVIKIRGKNVTLKSGIKTKYCEPSQDAAKQAIASFLGISPSLVTTGNSGAVKKEETKRKATSAAIMASVPSVSTNAASNPPPSLQQQQQQQKEPPLAMTSSSYPGMFMPPYAFPPQFPSGAAFGPPPPVFGNGVEMMPFHAGVSLPSMANVDAPQASLNVSSSVSSDFMVNAVVSQAPSTAAFLPPVAQVPQQQQQQASTSNGNVIVPTFEQERIYQHAKPPTPLDTSFTVRITAGAGAGKTTTILQVAAKAARLGHSHITYVTFAKAAAADGARRIQEALSDFPNPPTIEARTLHSCAMKLLSDERKEAFEEENKRLMDDEALQAFIKTTCDREIQDFLAHAKEEIASRTKEDLRMRASMLEAAERQVVFFIFKTFGLFCRSPYTVQQFKDPMFKYRNYYPAEKFHQNNADGEKQGFPSTVYSFKLGQYADMAGLVWEAATEQGLRSYDIEMKRAQLKALRIPGSLLLVDESQDMDGCQVDWISKQVNNGAHVYFVGDAAQTIYSFRGAKSKYMVNLKRAVDFELTTSWRFGSNIASVANVVLYSKHKSKQTQRDNATWQ